MEPDVLTEVPDNLKRLVRYVLRGFYQIEHALTMDILLHHSCMKEEDILELLKFERKQLRAVLNTLKNDKFLKTRMRVETDLEGKTTRHNYYFINYSVFVNVVKYKLDHMQRKIETEERDATNRASYKCPKCEKCFTDLEADQLFDPMAGAFICTFCNTEVEEEASNAPKTDARALMVTFNEQMAPLYNLLKEVEDIKLSQDILEPEPTDINDLTKGKGGARPTGERKAWSGETTKGNLYGYYSTDNQVTINMEGEGDQAKQDNKPKKERPVWMVESTIEGAGSESMDSTFGAAASASTAVSDIMSKTEDSDDIMKTLLAHEKKSAGPQVTGIPAGSDNESSTSDSDDEKAVQPSIITTSFEGGNVVEEMESDEDDDTVSMVNIGGNRVPYHDVTQEQVENMTTEEKEEYIRVGQEMYQNMYD